MANKYIFQLRRGWKNSEDGRDDWATYEENANHVKPLEGELVLEYDNGIPRLKIGDGIHKFSELPYMSVDSFILPKQISVTLYGSDDTENTNKPQWEEEVDEEQAFIDQLSKFLTDTAATEQFIGDKKPKTTPVAEPEKTKTALA